MARKQFAHHEAVSAVVPGEGGYSAAVAVKAINSAEAAVATVLESIFEWIRP